MKMLTEHGLVDAPDRDDIVITSYSDLDTVNDCRRKRFNKKIKKLPEYTKGSRTFGVVAHAVNERFLKADDAGYDENGEPVELYPPGWENAVTKMKDITGEWIEIKSSVTPVEQTAIKKMVDGAIDEGLLARRPQRRVEFEFGAYWKGQDLIKLVEHRGKTVCVTGLLDLWEYPHKITDWKTSKSKRYVKSVNKLNASIQARLYAKLAFMISEHEGWPEPLEFIDVEHVYFSSIPDDPWVRQRSTRVTREQAEESWKEFQTLGRIIVDDMLDKQSWKDIPFPEDGNVCSAYGGCAFAGMCLGQMTEEAHRIAVMKVEKSKQEKTAGDNGIMSQVNLKQFLMGGASPAAPLTTPAAAMPANQTTAAPVQQPTKAEADPPKKPAAVIAQLRGAPWADPNCQTCGGVGIIRSTGTVCQICDMTNQQTNKNIQSAFYDVSMPGDGSVAYKALPAYEAFLEESGYDLEGSIVFAPQGDVQVSSRTDPTPPEEEPQKATKKKTKKKASKKASKKAPETPPETASPEPAPEPSQEESAQEQPETGADEAEKPVEPLPGQPMALVHKGQAHMIEGGALAAAMSTRGTQGKGGRPKLGCTLVIGANPTKGFRGSEAIRLDELVSRYGEVVAQQVGETSWYGLDPFKRRDLICAQAAQLAEMCNGRFLFAPDANGNPEIKALVDALRPYCKKVIE